MLEKKKKKLISKKKQSKSQKSVFWDNICIISVFLVFLFLLGFSKYLEEKYAKIKRLNLSGGGEGGYSDLYEILEIDNSASLKEIKKQYKKLALIWYFFFYKI